MESGGLSKIFLTVFVVAILIVDSPHFAESAHIVFLHTLSTYSHRAPIWPLILTLMEHGHNITCISAYTGGSEMTHPNVTDLMIPEMKEMADEVLTRFDINVRIHGVQPTMIVIMEPVSYAYCSALHESPVFLDWLSATTDIDLVFSDINPECSYGLAAKFGAKHAIFQAIPLILKYYEAFGISPESGSIPPWEMLPGSSPLSFFRRIVGALIAPLWRAQQILFYNFMYIPLFTRTLGVSPELYDMEANTSLLLLNGNYLEDYPRSYPPFVVKVPGMHIRDMDAEILGPTIDTFISSNDSIGFIYISFGTNVNPPKLPLSFLDIFLDSVGAFPNIKFIWKWKGPPPASYPQNLLLIPWVNQQKLLAHHKIKGFITQAGRPSMQEAFYHSVPTIAFPILADQDFNAFRYQELGTTMYMDIASLSQADLTNAINRTVNDQDWLNRVEAMSRLGRDVPQHPVEVAVWWTEFILRHTTDELNLLKPLSQQMYWFQRRDLDVWTFLFCSSVTVSFGFYKFGSYIIKRLAHGRGKVKLQ